MAIKAEFDVGIDFMEFRTKTNGDQIIIKNVHLGQQQAENLAHLVNSGKVLTVLIKEKTE